MTPQERASPTVHMHLLAPGQLLPVDAAGDVLTAAEMLRFNRWLSPLRKREFLTGRALLRTLMAQHGLDPASLHVDVTGRLSTGRGDVSIAHSHGWVLAAVTREGTLGVDVELHAPRERALMDRFFSDDEQGFMGNNLARLHRVWTLKEAALKALGCGVSGDPARIRFSTETGLISDLSDETNTFHGFWQDVADVSVAAVLVTPRACVTTPRFSMRQGQTELECQGARDGARQTRKTA